MPSTTAAVMPPNRPLVRGRMFVEQVDRFAEGTTDLSRPTRLTGADSEA